MEKANLEGNLVKTHKTGAFENFRGSCIAYFSIEKERFSFRTVREEIMIAFVHNSGYQKREKQTLISLATLVAEKSNL